MRDDAQDLRAVLVSGVPLLDVRAPVEFGKGAFPTALNLPLMTDDERHQVGLCYKQRGQDAAIALGHQLVAGEVKAARIAAWADFARAHPDGYLYCFRGGLRSHIVQQWLREAGVDYPLVVGGYKALRTHVIEAIDTFAAQDRWWVLGGMTGTGKTEVVTALAQAIDLEGLAHHRGSSFGWRAQAQPTTIDFENRLGIDMLRRDAQGMARWLVEDESRCIGRCALPPALYQRMQSSPLVWLEEDFASRVERILHQYVNDQCREHVELLGEEAGFARFAAGLQTSLRNIRKRLGGERCERLLAWMQDALAEQQRSGRTDAHRAWIAGLLHEYYDPMYAFQAQSKAARIRFRGPRAEVLDFLRDQLARP